MLEQREGGFTPEKMIDQIKVKREVSENAGMVKYVKRCEGK